MTAPPRPHHLNLATADVAATAEFYRRLLDLTPVELPRDTAGYDAQIATLQDASGYQYHIILPDPDFAARRGLPVNPLIGHLAFRVADLAPIRAHLDAAGIPYSDLGAWAIRGWHQLFCTDPDGRVLEFHQVGAERGTRDGE